MSKLTELLQQDWLPSSNDTQGLHDPKWAGFVVALRRLLSAHDAEIREQAMREQMEADCKAICEECDLGEPVVGAEGEYGHASTGDPCDAHAIRAAWAKAHSTLGADPPEDGQ